MPKAAGKPAEVDPVLQQALDTLREESRGDFTPAEVWDWRAYEDRIAIVVHDGRKFVVAR